MLLVLKISLCAKCPSLHAKGLPPVRHAALLPGERQFSGGCKIQKACKITLQAFTNTFPTTQSTRPPSKSSSLTGCIYVSKPGTKAGNLPALPSCCAGPWHRFGSGQLHFSQAAGTSHRLLLPRASWIWALC